VLSSSLPCVAPLGRESRARETLLATDCRGYPLSLSLRIADGLPALPHLRRAAEKGDPGCRAWRALDDFLSGVDQKRYDPDALNKAVTELVATGHRSDAATLLTRQRRMEHCSPEVLAQARALGRDDMLGPGLRADLLSVVLNCSVASADADFVAATAALDELTSRQPSPIRNMQLIVFAVRLGLELGRWEPIAALCQKPDFVRRWLAFGPELATSVLLIHHASLLSAGERVDQGATLPLYRLLCTTFPPADRGPSCQALATMRGSAAMAERKRVAREALTRLVSQLTGPGPKGPR